jgi:hypothetical protein
MISKCANLDCAKSFNYQEGRFFRFRQTLVEGEQANNHSVEHYWLCGSCSEKFTLAERSQPRQIPKESRPSASPGRRYVDSGENLGIAAVRLIPRARLSPGAA